MEMTPSWSLFVTSTEANRPSGEVCFLRKESQGQSRFLHFAPLLAFARKQRGFGRNDMGLKYSQAASFTYNLNSHKKFYSGYKKIKKAEHKSSA
jgi:hypothetical protein